MTGNDEALGCVCHYWWILLYDNMCHNAIAHDTASAAVVVDDKRIPTLCTSAVAINEASWPWGRFLGWDATTKEWACLHFNTTGVVHAMTRIALNCTANMEYSSSFVLSIFLQYIYYFQYSLSNLSKVMVQLIKIPLKTRVLIFLNKFVF